MGEPADHDSGNRGADGADRPPLVTVRARGHEHVSATHASTLEVTTDAFLTPAGDCIVGIDAGQAPADVPDEVVERCRQASRLVATLAVPAADTGGGGSADAEADEIVERITGRGDPALTFGSDRGWVLRTSDHVDDRTVMVGADRAAADLDRGFVARLADGAPLRFTLAVG